MKKLLKSVLLICVFVFFGQVDLMAAENWKDNFIRRLKNEAFTQEEAEKIYLAELEYRKQKIEDEKMAARDRAVMDKRRAEIEATIVAEVKKKEQVKAQRIKEYEDRKQARAEKLKASKAKRVIYVQNKEKQRLVENEKKKKKWLEATKKVKDMKAKIKTDRLKLKRENEMRTKQALARLKAICRFR